jgi:hypothetical protein
MLKRLFNVFGFLSLTCSLSAGMRAINWIDLEKEACILEHTIPDCESEFCPYNGLSDTDPETKMPEAGIFYSVSRISITFYPEIKLLVPFVLTVNSFLGYTNHANAP